MKNLLSPVNIYHGSFKNKKKKKLLYLVLIIYINVGEPLG